MLMNDFNIKTIRNTKLNKFVTTGKYISYLDITKVMNELYPNNKFYLINFSKRFRTCYINFIANDNKRVILCGYVKGSIEDIENIIIMSKLSGKYREIANGRVIIYEDCLLNNLQFHLYEYQIYKH